MGDLMQAPAIHHLRVGGLLSLMDHALITQIGHLRVQACQRNLLEPWRNILQPLDNTDLQFLSPCTRLIFLNLDTSSSADLQWNALPNLLRRLTLQNLSPGPPLGSQLLNLMHFTIHNGSLHASDLVLLLHACPMMRRVEIEQSLVSMTTTQALKHLLFIRDYTEGRPHITGAVAHSSNVNISNCDFLKVKASGITFKGHADEHDVPMGAFLSRLQEIEGRSFHSVECSNTSLVQFDGPNKGSFLLNLQGLFPNLSRLTLQNCTVYDRDLLTLIKCFKLRELHMVRCSNVSGPAVVQLVHAVKSLLVLEAEMCPRVRVTSKQIVAECLWLRNQRSVQVDKFALLWLQSSQACVQSLKFAAAAIGGFLDQWCRYRILRFVGRRCCPRAHWATVDELSLDALVGSISSTVVMYLIQRE